ncbi:alpha/beta fold hydrolase [Amycolatopsis jejuensis]|uniref:alpha/beta fold hydrolase n=1 Tax=Amycolatopsis jejuensis TaxID=330084 RepID=UPI000524B2B0|nr:alpha/beta hydrolase [Amycolatopsis jejuensis]
MVSITGPAGSLSVDVSGAADGEMVLFIHPANLSAASWSAVAQRIDTRWLAVDLRAHGGSARSADLGVAQWAEDCLAVLDQLHSGPVHLVGGSVGAAVAIEVAARRAEVVRSVTTVGGGFLPGTGPELLDAIATLGPFEALQQHAVGEALAPGVSAALVAQVTADLSRNDAATTAAIWQAALDTDVRPVLDAVRAPLRVVVGEHDTGIEESRIVARLTGARLVELPGVGHLPMYEAPAVLTEHIGLSISDSRGGRP